mmetsp:Transcript_5636/g.22156  ORF Transcript_5636/g.22156 Transcript_5636/m.22156 type:complete len:312 (-) Transcript_5636:606-1541(-)
MRGRRRARRTAVLIFLTWVTVNVKKRNSPVKTKLALPQVWSVSRVGGGERGGARCGVVYFYHVPKTGGTTIARHLIRNGGCFNFFGRLQEYKWEKDVERLHELFEQVNSKAGSRFCVHHHHAGPMLHEFLPQLREWRAKLEKKGCTMLLATVLREPYKQVLSELAFNHISRESLGDWLIKHQSVQTQYLIFNHLEYYIGSTPFRNGTTQTKTGLTLTFSINRNRTYIIEAKRVLDEFDLIGTTDCLHAFAARLDQFLGRNVTSPKHENKTPQRQFIAWDASELKKVVTNVAFDQELVNMCRTPNKKCVCVM